MPTTTIAIDVEVREQLKTFGHAGMTYNDILRRMMAEIEREAFILDIRKEMARTKDEDFVDFEDLNEDFSPKAKPKKPARAPRPSSRRQKRHA